MTATKRTAKAITYAWPTTEIKLGARQTGYVAWLRVRALCHGGANNRGFTERVHA